MIHLLYLEWQKLRSYRLFQVMSILFITVFPLIFLAGRSIQLPTELGSGMQFYTFPRVWEALAYAGNWITYFFLGFLGVIMLTNEFTFKTLRQNLITGLSRRQYFLAKITMMLALAGAATLYYFIVALGVGYYYTDVIISEAIWYHVDMIPRFFLMSFAYLVFGFFFGMLIRRTGLALFIYFIYILIIEMVLRWWLHVKFFGEENPYRNWYPANAIEDLCPFPIAEMMPSNMPLNMFLEPQTATLLVLGYILLFLGISYRVFLKRDM